MVKRFLYFYLNKREPKKIPQVVPLHVDYWKSLDLEGYTGGPFSDRSGGLIVFEADSMEDATKIAMRDPFVLEDLVEAKWIKEWLIE